MVFAALVTLVFGCSVVQAGIYPPVADADGPYFGEVNQVINLDGSGSYDPDEYTDPPDPDAEVVSWEWDLDNDGDYDDAAGEVVQMSWGSPGTYVVGLKVTDNDQSTDEVDTIVTIGPASTPSVPLMGSAAIPVGIAVSAMVLCKKRRT
jgi:hypothetical protein